MTFFLSSKEQQLDGFMAKFEQIHNEFHNEILRKFDIRTTEILSKIQKRQDMGQPGHSFSGGGSSSHGDQIQKGEEEKSDDGATESVGEFVEAIPEQFSIYAKVENQEEFKNIEEQKRDKIIPESEK
jgi:hypothetical protein